MKPTTDRRRFLQVAGAASAIGLGELGFLSHLPAVSAADARADAKLVQLRPEIEPLVRLIEETPRDRLLEEIGTRIKKDLSYREVLAALLLAGVRNIQPRPSVGFKFHAVLVVNSAHQASMAAPDRERWLPLFWALDNFKSSQAQNQNEGGWRMPPVQDQRVPAAHQAREAFIQAMQTWDEEAADGAAAGLARHVPADEAFALFAHFGCRDFRDIGHKIIYVANAFRSLEVIGHHHAEPVYRSLAYALLRHDGKNPAQNDLAPDRPGKRNREWVEKRFAKTWASGQPDAKATEDLITALRTGTEAESAELVVKLLNDNKVSPQSVWDGLHLASGELLMRQPAIVALHSMTTLNALRYAYETTHVAEDRPRIMLQAASFLPLFREAMTSRGNVDNRNILLLGEEGKPPSVEAVFDTLSRDRVSAAEMAMRYLQANPRGGEELIATGRRLIFLKGTNSHDYKFSSAIMEDYDLVSPEYKQRFLAASLYWLKGSASSDSPILARTRAALA